MAPYPQSPERLGLAAPRGARSLARARIAASATLPSEFGAFRIHVFSNDRDHEEHVALVHGEVAGVHAVPTRLHSECLTGDVLGFAADERDYGAAAAMLRALGVQSIALMTNNPDKLEKLAAEGILVTTRIAHEIEPNLHNRLYLATKASRSGHYIGVNPRAAFDGAR